MMYMYMYIHMYHLLYLGEKIGDYSVEEFQVFLEKLGHISISNGTQNYQLL